MILIKSITLQLFITLCIAQSIKKILRIDRLEMCNQTGDVAITVDYLYFMNQERSGPRLASSLTFKRTLRALRLKVEITRCMSREALDTCEPYTMLKPLDTCSLIKLPNMAWTELVEAVHPPIRCPIRKAVYIMQNTTFDTDLFIFFSLENFYWRAKLYFFEIDEFVTFCADFHILKLTV